MKTYKLNFYGKEYNLVVKTSHYTNNDSLAVMIETDEGEPFDTITVNLADGIATDKYQYVDTNNCPWAENFIKSNGLGTPTGLWGYSGFCKYPLYQFNLKALN